jgi:hypothetical protein
VIDRAGNVVTVPPGELRISTASCLPGEVVTGGGLETGDSGNVDNVINPTTSDFGSPTTLNPTEWIYSYGNPGPDSVTIRAFVECAQLVDVP